MSPRLCFAVAGLLLLIAAVMIAIFGCTTFTTTGWILCGVLAIIFLFYVLVDYRQTKRNNKKTVEEYESSYL